MKNDIDTTYFKKQLLAEKEELEEDLGELGRANPDNEDDWEAVKEDLNVLETDLNELADEFEEFEEDTAILKELETRLLEVNHALHKIEIGEYGVCEVTGEPISEDRLEVNPAARALIDHTDELEPLYGNTDD